MKVLFAGTPEIAQTVLSALIDSEHEVCAVLTQPDRPAGRGRALQASPVKQLAEQHNIAVHQPEGLSHNADMVVTLKACEADLMIVVAYGLILPEAVLSIPRLGCWNIHVSLLPRWRGAAPIQRAIEAGDTQTGVTIMQMDAGLDTGDSLLLHTTEISPTDTAATLHDRLATMGATAVLEALALHLNGVLTSTPQSEAGATYAKKLSKAEALIDWNDQAEVIVNKIRAFNPWPVAYFERNGERVRVFQATVVEGAGMPGTFTLGKKTLDVQAGDARVRVTVLQLPGGKALNVADVLNAKRGFFE
jgi:methionyl-tRNA formyltransferase